MPALSVSQCSRGAQALNSRRSIIRWSDHVLSSQRATEDVLEIMLFRTGDVRSGLATVARVGSGSSPHPFSTCAVQSKEFRPPRSRCFTNLSGKVYNNFGRTAVTNAKAYKAFSHPFTQILIAIAAVCQGPSMCLVERRAETAGLPAATPVFV
jgi:hypothetical protein